MTFPDGDAPHPCPHPYPPTTEAYWRALAIANQARREYLAKLALAQDATRRSA